jgi:GH24 family phage-related lysozyme (muramidase)
MVQGSHKEILLPPAMWTVSPAGYDLIKRFEGCRLSRYRDSGGRWTIGYGHLMDEREPPKISQGQADALLKLDALKALHVIRTRVVISMWQCEVDALASLVFNIGGAAFTGSFLLTALNQRNANAVRTSWLDWDHVGHKVVKGLKARREAEWKLFSEVPF